MIITTEETKEDGIKFLNINVSDSEVERNPDRLCADAGSLEYVKSKTGVLDKIKSEIEKQVLEGLIDGVDDWFAAVKVNECLEIIDKYKAGEKE